MNTPLATKFIVGIPISDTPLITKALQYVRNYSTSSTYNHINRSLLLGFTIASKIPSLSTHGQEALVISVILHDLGFSLGHPPHSVILSQENSRTPDGGTRYSFNRQFCRCDYLGAIDRRPLHRRCIHDVPMQIV